MRIAMVSEHASPLAVLGGVDAGGQNVHVAALASFLARMGDHVVVHTRRDDPDLPRRVTLAPGVEVDHVDAGPPSEIPKDELLPHMDDFADELREQWTADRPDIVHAHFWMSALAALDAARDLDIPVVQTFHALGVVKRRHQGAKDTSPPHRIEIERSIALRCDRVIATCTDEVFELVRLGADRRRISVVPCGVDVERFKPDGPREQRRPGFHRLVAASRLVERKGIGNAVTALAELPDCELHVAGGPDVAALDADPWARRLRSLAEDLGVTDRVVLRGRIGREEMPSFLRSGDAVVCVPWYEPFGIVPLEAMACGVAVVASAVGGQIDSVVDGVTGVHVPPRDPQSLAIALGALLADPERRAALGVAGVARARRLFAHEKVAAASRDVYAEVLRARAAQRRGKSSGRRRTARGRVTVPLPAGRRHLAELEGPLRDLHDDAAQIEEWGRRLAEVLTSGGRLLAAGNGGSASQAQHLTSELVGRYRDDRPPFSAIPLCAELSALTAIGNDYGIEEQFARQVRAHGRPGDVLVALSTSGRSPNVLAAVEAAAECGLVTWALTGRPGSPLAERADESLSVDSPHTATVQEIHLIAIHLLCAAVDQALDLPGAARFTRTVVT